MCIGSSFASLEAPIILATVGQRYRFTIDPGAVISLKPADHFGAGQWNPGHPMAAIVSG